MMVVCPTCKKKMKCVKNGIGVRFQGTHRYAGDEFECPICEFNVIVTNRNADFSPNHNPDDLYMDKSYFEYAAVSQSINIRGDFDDEPVRYGANSETEIKKPGTKDFSNETWNDIIREWEKLGFQNSTEFGYLGAITKMLKDK